MALPVRHTELPSSLQRRWSPALEVEELHERMDQLMEDLWSYRNAQRRRHLVAAGRHRGDGRRLDHRGGGARRQAQGHQRRGSAIPS